MHLRQDVRGGQRHENLHVVVVVRLLLSDTKGGGLTCPPPRPGILSDPPTNPRAGYRE